MFVISYPFDVIILLKTQVHWVYVLHAQLIFITTALFSNLFRLILDSSDSYWMFVVTLELLSDENANTLRCYYIKRWALHLGITYLKLLTDNYVSVRNKISCKILLVTKIYHREHVKYIVTSALELMFNIMCTIRNSFELKKIVTA